MRECCFDQIIEILPDKFHPDLWRSSTNDFRSLMITIGRVQRIGATSDKEFLDRNLIPFGGASAYKIQTDEIPLCTLLPTSSAPSSSPQSSATLGRALAPTESGHRDCEGASPMHVVALKEYGDSVGQRPKYIYQTFASNPSATEMTVEICGRTFHTVGRSVKQARQRSAMAACADLGLHVPHKCK
jgi:hypothetical protein